MAAVTQYPVFLQGKKIFETLNEHPNMKVVYLIQREVILLDICLHFSFRHKLYLGRDWLEVVLLIVSYF